MSRRKKFLKDLSDKANKRQAAAIISLDKMRGRSLVASLDDLVKAGIMTNAESFTFGEKARAKYGNE